jgi:hypothetical protein
VHLQQNRMLHDLSATEQEHRTPVSVGSFGYVVSPSLLLSSLLRYLYPCLCSVCSLLLSLFLSVPLGASPLSLFPFPWADLAHLEGNIVLSHFQPNHWHETEVHLSVVFGSSPQFKQLVATLTSSGVSANCRCSRSGSKGSPCTGVFKVPCSILPIVSGNLFL